MPAALVVLAAGSGTRLGAEVNKILLPLGPTTVLGRSITTALNVPDVRRIVLVVRDGEQEAVSEAVAPLLGEREVAMVVGGATRHASEQAALAVLRADILAGDIDVVAIHDAARPLASAQLWTEVIDAAAQHGGAVPVVPTAQLSHRSGRRATSGLVAVQTPQAFGAADLLAAYRRAEEDGFLGTDTASCLERYAETRIQAVRAPVGNLKITFPEDIRLAEALLAQTPLRDSP